MSSYRFSHPLTVVVLGLVISGCAIGVRAAGNQGGAGDTITVVVENQSPDRFNVFFARIGSAGERLGRVNAMETRVFRLPARVALGARLQLYSGEPHSTVDARVIYATMPFDADGVSQVRWVIRSGERFAGVITR